MTRIGMNPARHVHSDYVPARVTAVMITYLPHLEGYFRHRFDVLRLSLTSLLTNTSMPCDFMVFDNGSCGPVVDYLGELRDRGSLHYLILSGANIGKIGAFQIVFNAAPGQIIAYTDDDILFYPDWLEQHFHILEAFPRAGMVSGAPVRNAATYAVRAVQEAIDLNDSGVTYRKERCIPDEWEEDWALSTGRDPEQHRLKMRERQDTVLCSQGVEAIAGSNHFQFAARKAVLLQAMQQNWTGKLMGQMVELDNAIDGLGYLRLSTTGRYARHLGNALSPALAEELRQAGFETGMKRLPRRARQRSWLLRIPGARRVLLGLYGRLFKILS
ncbi:MAG: glycosyltransferase family A protein [Omnitrophica WOR_2 bacterium]